MPPRAPFRARLVPLVLLAATAGVLAAPPAIAQPAVAGSDAAASAPAAPSSAASAASAAVAAPASAVVAARPASAAAPRRETVENPYGLGALIRHGDAIALGTLVILLLMSIGSWTIIVTKLVQSVRLAREARVAPRQFFRARTLGEATQALGAGSAFRAIADAGITASEHHEGALTENIDRNTWVGMNVQRSLDDVQSRLQDGLAFLATVGSTAPFIGLFGTVWGIYNALTAIGVAGQASIDKVAGPVGEALIMTALGLFVAVPAVLGYNWLVRRNKVTMESVRRFGADLHGVLMGAPIAATTTAASAGAAPAPASTTPR
ncbi:MotA/TolQ/ExbB proton channel family protein [Piscinibacter koreensis]|uniref:Biopolymer transport protein ExbB n=1 Tax=Piscinibacter koreensis TaxID=2742824 RepID=A0A7Y6NKV0_9BURK|nr:MotA/TolQ/ExbB proton channel family protein [Schlegelella koreensis]NUZ04946.1 MotA/TolQ/ExbB proton channel family protein [Schlegelella koreensis]